MDKHKDIIFLDTSIFENFNFLRGHQLQKLGELGKDGIISVKITDITYSEILGRIRKNLTATKTLFRKADKSFDQDGKILKNLDEFKGFYPMPIIDIEENFQKLKKKIDEFIHSSKIEIVSTDNASVKEVFEQYFNFQKPFGEGQKKSEFPDAFTLNAIEKWVLQNGNEVSVLATDKDLTEYIPKSSDIHMIGNLSEYLESITERLEKNKAKFEFIKLEALKVDSDIEWQLNTNLHDTIAYDLYDQIKDNPWMEEVEYEPAEFENTIIISSTITDIDEETIWIEYIVDTETKMNLNYNDLSTGIYDKEDGRWYNVEYVNEEKNYKTRLKLTAKFYYDYTDDDKIMEMDEADFIEVVRYEET